MKPLQKEASSLDELQQSYDQIYQGWLGKHRNVDQAEKMLRMLDVQPGRRVLDIGCGMGYVLDQAASKGLVPSGIDLSWVALHTAKERNRLSSAVVQGSAEDLPWADNTFDYVICLGSLEHFLDPSRAVSEAARVLKPDGKAAILVPNSHHIRSIYNVYKFGEVLSDSQDFERFATRREWETLLAENGLRVTKVSKCDMGMARAHKKGRLLFWYLYNILFHVFGGWWIPLNLTYSFIFISEKKREAK
ncbi:MAG TPA: class I SAM-dependent methyltransferase [bacterium]